MDGIQVGKALTIGEYMDVLHEFDRRLSGLRLPYKVEIRALGGFALLWHGIRGERGTTADIDTVTPSYPPAVNSVIDDLGAELGLEPEWLNNHTVYSPEDEVSWEDVEYFDSLVEAEYLPVDKGFTSISLSVADVDTLARSKALAINGPRSHRTDKDLSDLCGIIRHAGCASLQAARKRFRWLAGRDFSECCRFISDAMPADPAAKEPTEEAGRGFPSTPIRPDAPGRTEAPAQIRNGVYQVDTEAGRLFYLHEDEARESLQELRGLGYQVDLEVITKAQWRKASKVEPKAAAILQQLKDAKASAPSFKPVASPLTAALPLAGPARAASR